MADIAYAVRTYDTVKETASVGRIVGDSPYDIINQLDTEQIDLRHATQLTARTGFIDQHTPNEMIRAGFVNHNIKVSGPESSEFVKKTGEIGIWTGLKSISDDLQQFKSNELFILEPFMNIENFSIYSDTAQEDDKITPKDTSSWRETFSKTNPLFIFNVENGGISLPNKDNYINELTRYSTIIAPNGPRSSKLVTAILCNLHDNQRIGDIFRRARSRYYSITNPSNSEMIGINLKSYSLYGNPLTFVSVPEEYTKYIEDKGFLNVCKDYYVAPSEFDYIGFSSQTSDLSFDNSIVINYNLVDYNNFTIINSSDLVYYENPNAAGIQLIRRHRIPKNSFIGKYSHSFGNPEKINISRYPSIERGNLSFRNCFSNTMNNTFQITTTEKDTYDEISVFVNPLRIDNCFNGNFTIFRSIRYNIPYIPSAPFYFDNLRYPKTVAPGKTINVSADLHYVSADNLDGKITVVDNKNRTVYSNKLNKRVNKLNIAFKTSVEEGIKEYTLNYDEGKKHVDASFDTEVKVMSGTLNMRKLSQGKIPVTLNLINNLDNELDADIVVKVYDSDNREVYTLKSKKILSSGKNNISFEVGNLKKDGIEYFLKAYINYNTGQITISGIISTDNPPQINVNDDSFIIREGDKLNLGIKVYDPERDAVTYEISGISSENWQTHIGDEGVYNVSISASDGLLNSSKTVRIYVLKKNYPPQLYKQNDMTIEAGDAAVVILYADDIDGDNLTYNISDDRFVNKGDGWFEWQTKDDDIGDYNITYSVNDGSDEVKNNFKITIKPNSCENVSCESYCDGEKLFYSGACSEGECLYKKADDPDVCSSDINCAETVNMESNAFETKNAKSRKSIDGGLGETFSVETSGRIESISISTGRTNKISKLKLYSEFPPSEENLIGESEVSELNSGWNTFEFSSMPYVKSGNKYSMALESNAVWNYGINNYDDGEAFYGYGKFVEKDQDQYFTINMIAISCFNETPSCYTNSDCGTNKWDNQSICKNNDVFSNHTRYFCRGAGKIDAYCDNKHTLEKKESCEAGCENGLCISTEPECFSDLDCGNKTMGHFCSNDEEFKYVRKASCKNPGSKKARCVVEKTVIDKKLCRLGCDNDVCKTDPCFRGICENRCDNYKEYKGGVCINGGCKYSQTEENSSSCGWKEPICYSDTDCSKGYWLNKRRCINDRMIDDYRSYVCEFGGMPKARCVAKDLTKERGYAQASDFEGASGGIKDDNSIYGQTFKTLNDDKYIKSINIKTGHSEDKAILSIYNDIPVVGRIFPRDISLLIGKVKVNNLTEGWNNFAFNKPLHIFPNHSYSMILEGGVWNTGFKDSYHQGSGFKIKNGVTKSIFSTTDFLFKINSVTEGCQKNMCANVFCENKCIGYTYYYDGVCKVGACEYRKSDKSPLCGYESKELTDLDNVVKRVSDINNKLLTPIKSLRWWK